MAKHKPEALGIYEVEPELPADAADLAKGGQTWNEGEDAAERVTLMLEPMEEQLPTQGWGGGQRLALTTAEGLLPTLEEQLPTLGE